MLIASTAALSFDTKRSGSHPSFTDDEKPPGVIPPVLVISATNSKVSEASLD